MKLNKILQIMKNTTTNFSDKNKEWSVFAENELDKLKHIQNEFKKKHQIDSYSKWFYDAESALLRLYNDEKELFFKYVPIGTYSVNAKTWMWSWFNETTIEINKDETLKIKTFGLLNNYEKLINGCFATDEFDGSEFMAVSFFILGGVGVYKVNSDNVIKYMILSEIIPTEHTAEIQKLKQKIIDCAIHGFRRPAFICQHLNLKNKNGFEEAFTTYPKMALNDDESFQAWCNECEEIRVQHDGWNEQSEKFSKIKLICEDCYFDIKAFNQI